jgi:enterochelin esterase-like enzyme
MARRQRSTIAGRVDVTSFLLRGQRLPVRIYLPADYETSGREYPVVYMFDGHNLFDRTTSTYNKEWRIDETMQWLQAEGNWTPAIVVGMDAPQSRYERFAMYSVGYWEYRKRPDTRLLKRIDGYGDETAELLMTQVKPYVERTYRAADSRDDVGVAGSSMGGYMALYVGACYPESVSKVMAFSPVVMDFPMRGQGVREAIRDAAVLHRQRHYLDMGDREKLEFCGPADLVQHLYELRDDVAQGRGGLLARVIEGDRHEERAWARRFPQAYLWAFFGVPPGQAG